VAILYRSAVSVQKHLWLQTGRRPEKKALLSSLTGWLAYTLSWSNQQFDSLNQGKQFPFVYDRRHTLYLSVGYEINKHWQISANFLYASGSAFSLFKEAALIPGISYYLKF
jgi:hypothetical protein